MMDDFFQKEGNRLVKALPIYLVAQVTLLLVTFLDFGVYMESYQENHTLAVSPWLGGWVVLVLFGLLIGIILLARKNWNKVFTARERGKLAAGYLLGAIGGLLTLGIRFMPVIPQQYFYVVGGLIVLLAVVWIVWSRRRAKFEEIFP